MGFTKKNKKGGTRRVRIRELEPVKIYNVSRKNGVNLPIRKTYNKYRGQTGVIYGLRKSDGKYIINLGRNSGINVDPENVEFLNSSGSANNNLVCEKCGRSPSKYTEAEMFSGMKNVIEGRNMREELYVEQDTFKITKTASGLLYTYGLATCTALGFNLGNLQFLTHVSTATDVDEIIRVLQPFVSKVKPKNVRIWTGVGDDAEGVYLLNDPSGRSLKLVQKITNALGIDYKDIKIEKVCFAEIVP